MQNSLLVWIIVIAIVVVPLIAWLLYKAGFKVKKVKLKAPWIEADMERETEKDPGDKTEPVKPASSRMRTEAAQEALDGGVIEDSNIKGSADSGAKLKQKASGEGSKITGSDITLT